MPAAASTAKSCAIGNVPTAGSVVRASNGEWVCDDGNTVVLSVAGPNEQDTCGVSNQPHNV